MPQFIGVRELRCVKFRSTESGQEQIVSGPVPERDPKSYEVSGDYVVNIITLIMRIIYQPNSKFVERVKRIPFLGDQFSGFSAFPASQKL